MFVPLDQAHAYIPPINVVVQPPPGMPEWIKILITATVGALLGIISSIAMEFVKPKIAKQLLRRTVSTQLGAELIGNLNNIDAGLRIVKAVEGRPDPQQHAAMNMCQVLAASCRTDRFDYYFAEEKSLIYEIDSQQTLTAFYELTKAGIPMKAQQRQYQDLKQNFTMAAELARAYIKTHELTYMPEVNYLEESYMTVTGKSHIKPMA